MRQIPSRVNKAGFTLIELLIVVTVLVIVASAVTPWMISMKKTSDRRDLLSSIRRVAAEARERAIRTGHSTDVIYDDSASELQIEETGEDGEASVVEHVKMTSGVTPQRFQMAGKDATSADFKLTFSPDGRSNGGGIEFDGFAISVDQNGTNKFIDGTLPEQTDEKWQAGDLEKRA
jgi:prepilin-type N-terminal cleavage/methylation domain-containing protein